MMNDILKRLTILIGSALLLSACSGEYPGMPRVEVLNYQSKPTYGHLYDLSMGYAKNLNASVKADTLHPGMYADYGVTLAMMGHKGEACRMLNAEMKAFPKSKAMVTRIKQHLMPDMVGDTMAGVRDTADMAKLLSWAYDSITAMRPLDKIAAVIDSTDSVKISLQTPVDSVNYPIQLTANQKRMLLEEQQLKEARERQAKLDSITAAKVAAKEAREQAQLERKKEKQAQMKAREQANKEKAEKRRQEQKQREAERKARQKGGKK